MRELTIDERIKRMEVLMGLADPPPEWEIDMVKIAELRRSTGWGLIDARHALIRTCGDLEAAVENCK